MTRHYARLTAAFALAVLAIAGVLAASHGHAAAGTWRGLAVAPEHRCSSYDRSDYPYPRSVEREIVASMGGNQRRLAAATPMPRSGTRTCRLPRRPARFRGG